MNVFKKGLALLCTAALLVSLFAGLSLVSAAENAYTLTDKVEAGKTYVIVADGKYAMTNAAVDGLRTYSGASTTMGAAAVTISDNAITSEITDAMKWTFEEVSNFTAYDGEKVLYLKDSTGKYLRRGSMSQGNAALILADSVNATQRYFTWTAKAYSSVEKYASNESVKNAFVLYANTERAYGNDYAAFVFGGEYNGKTGFDIPDGQAQRNGDNPFAFMDETNCSKIKFYTVGGAAEDPDPGSGTGGDPTPQPGDSDYDVIFMSDLHNGVGGYNNLKEMLPELVEEGVSPRVISHGGDYVEDGMGGNPDWQTKVYDVISGTEKTNFPNAEQVYTMGNHDWESGTFGGNRDKEAAFKSMFGFDRTGKVYEDDEMIIYTDGAQGETGSGGGGESFIQADIDALAAYLETVKDSGKVFFFQTHWPAHSGYNFKQRTVGNADKIIDLFNQYGDDMDIVWIWGHNHYEDAQRYVIAKPGDQIMYAADSSSSWGNPVNPKYKTLKFTYANAGCMNDMWYLHTGSNNTNASNNYRGPAACLSVAVEAGELTFTYNRMKQENGVWTFSHDANIDMHNGRGVLEHPSTVTVERKAADHEHNYVQDSVVAPTCTAEGYTLEKCTICGATRKVEKVPAKGHTWKTEKVVTAPTCTVAGYTTYTCSVCGATEDKDPTDPLGHDWDDGVVTTPATTEKAGVMTYTCKRPGCGETKTQRIPRLPGGGLADIDFTDPGDAGKFEVVNKDTAEIAEGKGLDLTPTADAFEPISAGWGGDAAESAPKDLIKVPVSGDWTATLKLDFSVNNVQWAMSTFLGFLAMEGEDYQNMVGIRGTNNVFQDYLRKEGTIADPTVAAPGWQDTATSGFTADGTYWLKLDKEDTTYAASWSPDGETWSELFKLEDTGVDAEYIVIDAYKTSSMSFGGDASWIFTLKSLEFEGGSSGGPGGDDWVLADSVEKGVEYLIVADGKYALSNKEANPGNSYSDGGNSLASVEVTIEDGVVTSEVTDDMIWTFADASASLTAADGQPVYFVKDSGGKYLHRTSGSTRYAPLRVADEPHSTMRYNTWSLKAYEGDASEYAMYCATERAAGTDYPFHLNGTAAGFDAPGNAQRSSEEDFSFMQDDTCSHITFYTRGTAPEPPQLDKSKLEAAIAAADKVEKDKYTEATVKALENAVTAGQKALTEAKKQSELDAAEKAITDAIAGLQLKPTGPEQPDLTALEAAIAAAEALKEEDYTAESWAAMQTALTAAKAAKTAETQDEVDTAAKNLNDAVSALVEKGDNPPPFEFDDVKDTSKFYYNPVYWAVNHEPQITNGATPTTFNPDGACTRGHVVTFLWRAAGEPTPTSGSNPFTDLKEGAFYYNAVLWAVENGITTGASKTTFAPGKPCTRGQIVTFLWRFKNSPEPTSTENPFSDVKADGFYYKAVLWAVENEITSGTGKGKFSPDSTCTRGQVVTFLYRAADED